jgi:hypothetical protein
LLGISPLVITAGFADEGFSRRSAWAWASFGLNRNRTLRGVF